MPLNEAQRTLVAKKFEIEILQEASSAELRRNIASAAPPRIDIALLDFPKLRCLSLQCRSLPMTNP